MTDSHNIPDPDNPKMEFARRAFAALQPCLAMQSLPHDVRKEITTELGISSATLYRYLDALRQRPVASTLLPAAPALEAYKDRNPSQSLIIQNTIAKFYLTQQKRSISSVYRELINACVQEGVTVPSYSTFRRRISQLNKKKRIQSRIGARDYASSNSPKTATYAVNKPLEVVQVDHTKVDLMLVDSVSGEEIGRPWITALVDVYSRLVLSFHLSLDPPSSRSVAEALTKAVYGNEAFLKKHTLNSEWPRLGLPNTLHMDNAAEFRSYTMRRGAGEHGMELYYRPPGRPHYGGHIESLIGTIMSKVHEVPGTTFSNTQKRGTYDSSKKAIFTLWDLNKFIAHFICEDYHKSIHSSLGTTPLHSYEQALEVSFVPRQPVKHRDEFRADFMARHRRKVRRSGIHYETLCYSDPFVDQLWEGDVSHVHVIPRANDVSKIEIIGPDKRIYTVVAKDPKTPSITWGEYKQLRRSVIARAKSQALTHAEIAARVQAEHAILSDAKDRKKRNQRAAEARRQAQDIPQPKATRKITLKRKPGRTAISTDRLFPGTKTRRSNDEK